MSCAAAAASLAAIYRVRPYPGKETAEVHDYHDVGTGVLAATLTGRAPGYTSLGFPDPRRITPPLDPACMTALRARAWRQVPGLDLMMELRRRRTLCRNSGRPA